MLWGILNNQAWLIGKLFFETDVRGHGSAIDTIQQILALKQVDLINNVSDANTIHRNFFHNELSDTDFERYRNSVEDLMRGLDQILTDKFKEEGLSP